MKTLLEFIAQIAPILYGLAAVGIFFSIRGWAQSQQALRVAVFGLEREAAKETRRRATSTIFLLMLLAGAVYINANIVLPNLSGPEIEPTPTSSVFVTLQPTPTESRLLYPTITPTSAIAAGSGSGQSTPDPSISGCDIVGARITNPVPGQTVAGQVSVEGEANILDQAQYKFELKGAATGNAWIVVGTFSFPVPQGFLGNWDSTSLMPGDYLFRLVILRADGSYPTPCEVPIVIASIGPAGDAPAQP